MNVQQNLSDKDLVRWHDIQHAYNILAYTSGMVMAVDIINNGTSDDCFTNFQSWLIEQGKAVYETALLDPDSLASVDVATEKGKWKFCGYIASFSYDYRLIQDKLQQNRLPLKNKPFFDGLQAYLAKQEAARL